MVLLNPVNNKLYYVWEEVDGSSIYQLRTAEMNGHYDPICGHDSTGMK